MYEWWDSIGDALGFYETGGAGEESDDSDLEVDDDFDPYDKSQITKLLADQIAEQVGPIAEFVEQQAMTQQEQEALAAAEAEVTGQVEELMSETNLSEEALQEVLELAEMFIDSDNPVRAGFEKYQSLVGKGEANLFQDKLNQPGTPEGSGPAAITPDAVTSDNVKEKVLERLTQQTQLTG